MPMAAVDFSEECPFRLGDSWPQRPQLIHGTFDPHESTHPQTCSLAVMFSRFSAYNHNNTTNNNNYRYDSVYVTRLMYADLAPGGRQPSDQAS